MGYHRNSVALNDLKQNEKQVQGDLGAEKVRDSEFISDYRIA